MNKKLLVNVLFTIATLLAIASVVVLILDWGQSQELLFSLSLLVYAGGEVIRERHTKRRSSLDSNQVK